MAPITQFLESVRTTLYWNPKITTENGIAEISFFTCDNVSRYKIFVEGITNIGRICLGSRWFEVNQRKQVQSEL